MKRLTKTLAALLSLVLVLGMLPITATADVLQERIEFGEVLLTDQENGSSLTYALAGGEVTIIGYNGLLEDTVEIPETVGDYPVVAIAEDAFAGCSAITGLAIPVGIVRIGDAAFKDCIALVDVWYAGSAADKSAMTIGENNTPLANATWHFEGGACTDHDFDWVIDQPADCGNDGKKHEACSVCGEKRNENTIIPATGEHTYADDCDEECDVCHKTRTVEHNYTNENYDDDNHWMECECGAVDEDSVEEHEYTFLCGWDSHWYACLCGHEYGNEPHEFEWVIDQPADCGNDGKKHEECVVCWLPKNENTPIPATGDHIYDNDEDMDCNVCGQPRPVAPPAQEGWVKEGDEWYFYENGTMLNEQWLKDGDKWYYLEADGSMAANKWKKDSVGWVYLGSSGAMLTNAWCTDSQGWCYVGADGYAVTNCWKRDSYGWIWLNANGSMTKNAWVLDGGKWYFLDANGYMVSNKWMKDSKGWVYLGASGAMLTNAWCKDSVGWCYVGADGYAVTNCWKKDSVGWCYLNANGSMTKNNWVKDGGKWYYLDGNGYMVANKTLTIGGKAYRFNASGVCLNP